MWDWKDQFESFVLFLPFAFVVLSSASPLLRVLGSCVKRKCRCYLFVCLFCILILCKEEMSLLFVCLYLDPV